MFLTCACRPVCWCSAAGLAEPWEWREICSAGLLDCTHTSDPRQANADRSLAAMVHPFTWEITLPHSGTGNVRTPCRVEVIPGVGRTRWHVFWRQADRRCFVVVRLVSLCTACLAGCTALTLLLGLCLVCALGPVRPQLNTCDHPRWTLDAAVTLTVKVAKAVRWLQHMCASQR